MTALDERGVGGEEAGVEEPSFSDDEGYKDPIKDEELIGDVLREAPKESELVEEAVMLVDGIPTGVEPSRLPKLKTVLAKIFAKFGEIRLEHYPLDEDSKTLGYCFVAYATKEAAREAVSVLDGYSLDKSHTFRVNLATDLAKYSKPDEKWTEPTAKEYKDLGNLRWWLEDERCLEQFVMQYADDKTGVYWNIPHETDPQAHKERERWTDTIVQWSPQGTYLATFHAKGIALWAGKTFDQAGRFEHSNVHFIDFSPCEKYLVTYSPPTKKWEQTVDSLRIYEVATGAMRRGFGTGQLDTSFGWPYIRWAPDDSHFASATSKGFAVYETESFSMLDKRSVKVDDLKDFAWSRKQRLVAYWAGESGEIPARVALMRFPQRMDVRSKNLFNVASATLVWQESGDHLAVQVERYSKKKKKGQSGPEFAGLSYTVEVFNCRDRDFPVDTVDVGEKTLALAWEPSGTKFCLISGNNPSTRTNVSFYTVAKDGTTQVMKTLDQLRSPANTILWAPSGGWVALASLGGSGAGALIFVDTNDKEFSIMSDKSSHDGMTQACWDPSGRYLATSTSMWEGRSVDLGYRIWNFQGKELCRRMVEHFCSFAWRPRPKPLLGEDAVKKVKKELKSYSARFEEADKRERGKASREVVERRQELANAFAAWRAETQALRDEEEEERQKLRSAHPHLVPDFLKAQATMDMEEETIVLPLTRKEIVLERNTEE